MSAGTASRDCTRASANAAARRTMNCRSPSAWIACGTHCLSVRSAKLNTSPSRTSGLEFRSNSFCTAASASPCAPASTSAAAPRTYQSCCSRTA